MDPVTVIVAALTAGAVAGAQGTAATAVGELYSGLKALIASRFRGKPAAEAALRKFETDRETWACQDLCVSRSRNCQDR